MTLNPPPILPYSAFKGALLYQLSERGRHSDLLPGQEQVREAARIISHYLCRSINMGILIILLTIHDINYNRKLNTLSTGSGNDSGNSLDNLKAALRFPVRRLHAKQGQCLLLYESRRISHVLGICTNLFQSLQRDPKVALEGIVAFRSYCRLCPAPRLHSKM